MKIIYSIRFQTYSKAQFKMATLQMIPSEASEMETDVREPGEYFFKFQFFVH